MDLINKCNISFIMDKFCESICEMPTKVCEVCKKFWFKYQMTKNKDTSMCTSCHSYLRKGKCVPWAEENKLTPALLPETARDLNALERFLVTPILPFVKVVPLVKGGQISARGPVICVAADIQSTTNILPRTIDTEGLIKVKLKRKLSYKGYHMHQHVRPANIRDVLAHLKATHPAFSGLHTSIYVYMLHIATYHKRQTS